MFLIAKSFRIIVQDQTGRLLVRNQDRNDIYLEKLALVPFIKGGETTSKSK